MGSGARIVDAQLPAEAGLVVEVGDPVPGRRPIREADAGDVNQLLDGVHDGLPNCSRIEVSLDGLACGAAGPDQAVLAAGQMQQFTAIVAGAGNTQVNWSVSPNAGVVSATGLYTAPGSFANGTIATVTATSVADPSKSDTATISLVGSLPAPPATQLRIITSSALSFPFVQGGSVPATQTISVVSMNPEKGVHRAIAVARAAGKPLIIAAKMWEPAELRYFADAVEPFLSHDIVYVGQVAGQRKLDLLAGATALVNPIRWPEPFGLVMIEALACGTPVLTFAEGSAPEIVEHGRTGFICTDEADMAQRVAEVADLDRRACRASVAERFSRGHFIDRHVALYRRVLNGHRAMRPVTTVDAVSASDSRDPNLFDTGGRVDQARWN